ncbi:hypothetical protein ASPWEDRAFT_114197 [Aspergillus wentii DTO 134E9]|uniref:laccase n=1 Tax=Aspergillus wentii DTO 134E9 TaxID=1073089 RepID=A0A1L9RFZ5_ASPWE|nr:uncharacterized protein ASPWEDRAFT_114197 [Aspergillus wentii DTO 134E9]KAI9925615.1 hypothetical protein MW887_005997 [Aspergillus wentii]OJJ33856.1 hypothetical protein ASPWEDRAFT_114197 [Aspergillus wentii DTO 134E9]
MKSIVSLILCGFVASASSLSLNPSSTIAALSTSSASPCAGNTANNRQQWCDYNINTDYTSVVPDTGVTREYYFNLEKVTVAPDGRSRFALAINGSIPGPTIEADWGDWVVVHVTNSLPDTVKNGTSVHFHGIRQYHTNPNDGVVSITQCPTAPNNTITYKWRAMQYGTTWYHSHIGLQAWEGLFGGIVINGPASANYDEDKGVIIMNDWDINTVDELYATAQSDGPPTLDSALINGTNVFGQDGYVNQTGYRFNTSFTEGTSYRLRLVNAACDTHFKFMIDNHTLTVMAADLVPIEPYNTSVLNIAMGQRYDVVVHANKASIAENFWLRAIPQTACSDNLNPQNIKGIIYYGDSPSTPNTTEHSYTDSCEDESMSNLVPIISETLPSTPFYNKSEPVSLGTNSQSLYRWKLNSTSMHVDWTDPTLLEIYRGHHSFANTSGVVQLPRANQWTYVIIETTLSVPHPIHLHGHDFIVVAQGSGTYDGSGTSLANPPKRDTAMLPENGHLVVAFKTDNPGAWLMHCHIGWHTEEGFAIQFVERYSEIQDLIDNTSLKSNCESWEEYQDENDVDEDDSGV